MPLCVAVGLKKNFMKCEWRGDCIVLDVTSAPHGKSEAKYCKVMETSITKLYFPNQFFVIQEFEKILFARPEKK